jgi:hypothetical protein
MQQFDRGDDHTQQFEVMITCSSSR